MITSLTSSLVHFGRHNRMLSIGLMAITMLLGPAAASAMADPPVYPVVTSISVDRSSISPGEAAVITATATAGDPGTYLYIFPENSNQPVAVCGSESGACSAVVAATWDMNKDPHPLRYFAAATGGSSSSTISIDVLRRTFNVGLTADKASIKPGETSVLTATVDRSLAGTGYSLYIFREGGSVVAECAEATASCSAGISAGWDMNLNHPDQKFYAVVGGRQDQPSNVAYLTVATERVTFDVTLTASKGSIKPGETSVLTATVDRSLAGTGYSLYIFREGGSVVAECAEATTSCSATVGAGWDMNLNHPDQKFYAVVGGRQDQPSNVANLTVATQRVIFGVTLTASKNPIKPGETTVLTAAVDQSLAGTGYTLYIFTDGGGVMAVCDEAMTCSAAVTAGAVPKPVSGGFYAVVGGRQDQPSNVARLSIATIPDGRDPAELYGGCNAAEPGCDETTGFAADPVSTQSGNFHDTFTDLTVPGRGPAINLSRTYNSGAAATDGIFGNGWSSPYGMSVSVNPTTRAATVRQENGSEVIFAETGNGNFVAAPRVQATLHQNSDNTWTYVRRSRETFEFTAGGRLRSIEDRNGYRTTVSYPSSSSIVVDAPGGRTLTLAISAGGHVTSATQNSTPARTVTYDYSADRNLTRVVDVLGNVSRYTYYADDRMATIRSPKFANDTSTSPSPVVTNEYDASGRVVKQTNQIGKATTFDYTSVSGATVVTDPSGRKRLDSYQDGLRMSVTRGFGSSEAASWTYLYDPNTFQVTSKCNPYSHCTSFTYDSRGNTLSAKDPLNRTTSYEYNAQNDVTSVTDPAGTKATLDYDSRGNLLSISRPLKNSSGTVVDTQTTTFVYDPNNRGDVTQVTDPLGKVWKFTYDNYGNQISETAPPTAENAAGNKTTRTFDASTGAITSEVAPKGNLAGATPSQFTTKFTPDAMGRITTVFDPLYNSSAPLKHRSVTHYDANGNIDYEIDSDGDQTNYTYDAADQLKTITRPNGTTLGRTYDDAGRLSSEINGLGAATSYTYDAIGYPLTTTDETGQITTTSYDAVGNLKTRISPGGSCAFLTNPGCAKFTYDAAGQLTGYGWAAGQNPAVSNIAYNANGQRTSITDATGTTTQTFDNLGRMTSRTDGYGANVTYGYDIAGGQTSIRYPGNKLLTRTLDAAGRLTSLKDWNNNTTTFEYDANSNLTKTTFPSATTNVDTNTYDNANQLMGITAKKGATTLASFTYTRTGSGQLASSTTTGISEVAQSYTYNTLGQLTKSGPTSAQVTHNYNAADRLTQRVSASTQSFDARGALCWTTTTIVANPSCTAPPAAATKYVYSPSGNRTKMTQSNGIVTNYTFNENDELTNFNAAASYVYDADGLRASKTLTGQSPTRMVWDKTASEPDLLSDGQNTYIYGPGGLPIQQISSTGTNTYLHHDQLGSTRLITNSTGANAASYNFDAYGKQLAKTGTATTPLGYAGQYTDAESGLIYMRARYYDPATGTFISKDPIGSAGSGQNQYGYVSGDPTNAVDPSGLWGMWISDIAAGILNGATGGYLEKWLGLDPSCASGWGRTAGDLLSWVLPAPGRFLKLGRLATRAKLAEEVGAAPAKITGYAVSRDGSRHGLHQAISRDGGRGVSPRAMVDAVRSGESQYQAARKTWKYVGDDAVVVLNSRGQVVTTWSRGSRGWRNQP